MKSNVRAALLLGSLALFLALAGARYYSERKLAAVVEGFDGERAFEDLRYLVALGPRPPDSTALEEARKYIAQELANAGAEVSCESFMATTPMGNVAMQNIVGRFRGQQRGIVIIAGHYDTARLPGVAFIGANDGGSSAAELLELARVLRKRTHSLTYWLVFFDGEEAIEHWSATDSLYGSRHFVETLRASGKLSEVRAVLLLDMVAGGSPQFQPEGNSTPWLRELVFSSAHRLDYRDAFPSGRALPVGDDHVPFLAAGVPAVDIIDFAPFLRGYHHTAQDTIDQCSPDTMRMVGRVVLATLSQLDRRLDN